MNITHPKISAAAPGNYDCGYSLVRRIAAGCLIASAVMSSAVAGPRDRDERAAQAQALAQAQAQAQRDSSRFERVQPRQDERRPFDARSFEARADEQRRSLQIQQEQSNQESFRRSGRLTPDERRDLRRQINEAGQDLYPSQPRR